MARPGNAAAGQPRLEGVIMPTAHIAYHRCTFCEFTPTIPDLIPIFFRDESQQIAGWYPEVCSPVVYHSWFASFALATPSWSVSTVRSGQERVLVASRHLEIDNQRAIRTYQRV